jgi:hypothetical protein
MLRTQVLLTQLITLATWAGYVIKKLYQANYENLWFIQVALINLFSCFNQVLLRFMAGYLPPATSWEYPKPFTGKTFGK